MDKICELDGCNKPLLRRQSENPSAYNKRRFCSRSHANKNKQVRSKVDDKIEALFNSLKPGETLTRVQIATACGCSISLIQFIENNAIKKLRERTKNHPIRDYINPELYETKLTNPLELPAELLN